MTKVVVERQACCTKTAFFLLLFELLCYEMEVGVVLLLKLLLHRSMPTYLFLKLAECWLEIEFCSSFFNFSIFRCSEEKVYGYYLQTCHFLPQIRIVVLFFYNGFFFFFFFRSVFL